MQNLLNYHHKLQADRKIAPNGSYATFGPSINDL
jgi:hypothetical protein